MVHPVDPATLWKFKALLLERDQELASCRVQLAGAIAQRNALIEAFATVHGVDSARSFDLDDVAGTVTQCP